MAELRQKLLDELKCLLPSANPKSTIHEIAEGDVIRGCAAIRLYSALKCIAGLKYVSYVFLFNHLSFGLANYQIYTEFCH